MKIQIRSFYSGICSWSLIILLFFISKGFAQQAGQIDLSFNPTDRGYGSGNGFVYNAQSAALQADGKIVVGGYFVSFNSSERDNIVRLNTDGSLDTTFHTGAGTNHAVNATVIQPDGKILIAGPFTTFNGVSRNGIARLNNDGTLDQSFNPGTGINYAGLTGDVHNLYLQSDGKIIIVGSFNKYNGVYRSGIARINTDGTLDAAFNTGTGIYNSVYHYVIYTAAIQPNGKILIGGSFPNFNGIARKGIARLNSDGSLDTGFNPGTGLLYTTNVPSVGSIAVQTSGKILIGGNFTSYNGTARKGFARLNANGSLDSAFNPTLGGTGGVGPINIQANGKVLIGGGFTSYNGVSRKRIARILDNGNLDTSFNPGAGFSNSGLAATAIEQPDGNIIIGGYFETFNNVAKINITRITSSGAIDYSFNPHTGADDIVSKIAVQPDGKILTVGMFRIFNGIPQNRLTRLNPDGTIDNTFLTGTAFDEGSTISVTEIALQPDGKILLGGSFSSFNGSPKKSVLRLNPDGSLDTTFDCGSGTGSSYVIRSITLQADGKIIVTGDFLKFNGINSPRIARINSDGTSDATFNPGTNSFYCDINATVQQPDGKLLVAGDFSTYNGVTRNGIARLNQDGTLDLTFDPGAGTQSEISAMVLQADGKILIGGKFASFAGLNLSHIARLNSDGSPDAGFNPGTGFSGTSSGNVFDIILQPDGKYLVTGSFTEFNGVARKKVARLHADGTLDTSFNSGRGADHYVETVALQADGKVLIGGWLTSYDGIGRNRIARLQGDGVTGNPELLMQTSSLYPNPTSGLLKLVLPAASESIATVEVINAVGQVVFVRKIGTTADINLTHLPSGPYWVKVRTSEKSSIQKLVLQR